MRVDRSDLVGEVFGGLSVLSRGVRNPSSPKQPTWLCVCDCGRLTTRYTGALVREGPKMCQPCKLGLLKLRNRKHGMVRTQLWTMWVNMRRRCENPKTRSYKTYGARGVSVCAAWQDFGVFSEWAIQNGFVERKGVPHRLKLSIERIDPSGNYEPSNCEFITVSENSSRSNAARKVLLWQT